MKYDYNKRLSVKDSEVNARKVKIDKTMVSFGMKIFKLNAENA